MFELNPRSDATERNCGHRPGPMDVKKRAWSDTYVYLLYVYIIHDLLSMIFCKKLDSHRKSELPTDRSVRAVADCKACIPAFNTNIQLDISFLISIQKFTMESHGIFWIELVSLCVFCWWSSSSWQVTPFKKLQEDVGNKQ